MPLSKEAIERLARRDRLMMMLLADGKTNQEIAAHFGVSFDAVKSRLALYYRRYEVHGRQELVQAIHADRARPLTDEQRDRLAELPQRGASGE